MKCIIKRGMLILMSLVFVNGVFAQNEKTNTVPSSGDKIYSDFDFVLGSWDFYTSDGTKIGEQIYTKREEGHLIVEEWKLDSGGTGMGMSFVDPKTGLWRQVWMSPMYHIDYSGGIDENGAMVLEGTLFPNNSDESSPIRGIWANQTDGSIKQEFFVFDEKSNTWNVLFAGYTLPKKE